MYFDYPIIDIHSHVLPGLDDGSRDLPETLKLLEMAEKQGIKSVIATPHCPRSGCRDNPKARLESIRDEIRNKLPEISLFPGHETFYHDGLVRQLRAGEAVTLADSNYVLVEFRTDIPYSDLYRGIRTLLVSGFVPVLAHMERYECIRAEKNLLDLIRSGCLFQMNYSSITGSLFDRDARWCRKQVRDGRISFMATDMHRTDFRPPDIGDALKWLDGHVPPERIRRMLYENPLAVIERKE